MKTLPPRLWILTPENGILRSFDVNVETPGAVTQLQTTQVSQTFVDIVWFPEPNSFAYNIYQDDVQIFAGLQNVAFRVTGLTAGTTYSFEVRGVNVLGVEGPDPAAPLIVQTLPQVATLTWPTQAADGRIHALPGINMFGSDSFGGSGRNTSEAVNTYIVDRLGVDSGAADGTLGSDTYRCSLEWALEHNAGASAKQIIIATSGIADFGKQIVALGGNTSIWGQFAPAPGFYMRNTVPNLNGTDNWQIWHMANYVGETIHDGSLDADGWKTGGAAAGSRGENIFYVNCEFAWTCDEGYDGFNGFQNLGFIYCMWMEGLHDLDFPVNNMAAFGPLLGGGGAFEPGNVSFERCVIAHYVDRQPYIGASRSTVANTLVYNAGRLPTGVGRWALWTNQFEHPNAVLHNHVNSMIVRGPNNNNTIPEMFIVPDTPFPLNSGVFLSGNGQHGWPAITSQADLVSTPVTNFTLFANAQSSALPSGRLTNFTDTYTWAADPHNPTLDERRQYLDLMESSCGMMPALRTGSQGRAQLIFTQIRNAINGISQSSQMRTGVANGTSPVGTVFTAPVTIVDPLAPGVHWHAPLPVGAGVHTPYVSGTFSNGMSRVGYTPREVWAIEQHWFRGGR